MDVLIVDDDQPTGLYLSHIVAKIPDINVLAVITSGEEAIRFAQAHKPQVVFLDIDMPGMNGLEAARTLADLYSDIIVIFATAYPNYALDAFEVYSFDYILKPFDEERIRKTLTKLSSTLKGQMLAATSRTEAIPVQSQGRTYLLNPDEILYIESSRTNVLIKTTHRELLLKGNLADWAQRLQQFGIIPSHRSYLVNVNKVREIKRSGYTFNIKLYSGENIPLSRNCAQQFKNRLGKL